VSDVRASSFGDQRNKYQQGSWDFKGESREAASTGNTAQVRAVVIRHDVSVLDFPGWVCTHDERIN